MSAHFEKLAAYIPAEVNLSSMARFLLIFVIGSLVLGLLGRVLLGKRSSLNHAVSSAMGILFLYTAAIAIYTFNPYNLSRFLAPMPLVSFSGETLTVFSFENAELPAICQQVLSTLILAFLVNLLDVLLPKGKSVIGWFFFRFLTVVLAFPAHFLVSWAFNSFLPGVLASYAPIILLGVLAATLLLGLLKVVLGLVLTVTNPILGAIYTFFFSNFIGKALSKSVCTTLLLCGVAVLLERMGYAVVCISSAALGAYVPLLLALLLLWYLLGHVL